MANRQITRRIAISAAISILLVFFLFIRPQGPPSPAIRAPGHITHNAASPGITIQEETLKGDIVMPKLGNATAKYVPAMIGHWMIISLIPFLDCSLIVMCRAELGRATWKYFHTVMARFPEKPTDDQQDALRSYIHLFARLYPWYDLPLAITSLYPSYQFRPEMLLPLFSPWKVETE